MSLKQDLRTLQEGGDPEIHERVDLRAWTVLGVGGLADLLIRCRSPDGLCRALDLLATRGERWLVLGTGSRMVPPDAGLRVPVINLSGTLNLWQLDLDGAVAGGGAIMAQVCRAATRSGLRTTIPPAASTGSVGGAVAASASGVVPLGKVFEWVETARPGAAVERSWLRTGDEHTGGTLDRRVVVRARLRLAHGMAEPPEPSATRSGRPFEPRRPRTLSPAFVDSSGADPGQIMNGLAGDGASRGGAILDATAHNRIVTTKAARSSDVLELVRMIVRRAARDRGVGLRPTLAFVDEHGRSLKP